MSVEPDSLGEPSEEANEYLKEANAEDPRSDQQTPAHEPAGSEPGEDQAGPS